MTVNIPKVTVNGVTSDENGNIEIEVGMVKTVNDIGPDESGNVIVEIPEVNYPVTSVNGMTGDVVIDIPEAVTIDTTLSISGQAADAKAVGDKLAEKADADHVHDDMVKTVNGIAPDENGNVAVEIPEAVTSWNDLTDRPFYEEIGEVAMLDNVTMDCSSNPEYTIPGFPYEFTEGNTYTVTVNGTEYSCMAYMISVNGTTISVIGNATIIGETGGNNEPFIAYVVDGTFVILFSENGTYTVTITGLLPIVHELDEKFIPYTVGRKVTGQIFTINNEEVIAGKGAEIFNHYEPDGVASNIATGIYSHAEGWGTTASGEVSHTEGWNTTASGEASHAEGWSTTANGNYSHAEGDNTTARGPASHAEGYKTIAWQSYSHAEGWGTGAYGHVSHAEGYCSSTDGVSSHAEGYYTTASGNHSHTEGSHTTASGTASHAEGELTTASGDYSHAEGLGTTAASDNQHVQGKYNIEDSADKYAHIVGNGTNNTPSNAHTLDWEGNAWFAGDVYVGSTSGTDKDDGSVKLAKITDIPDSIPTPTTATVGQTVVVKAVDENGKPTEWEAVDMPDVNAPKNEFTLNSSTEGSTKRFNITIDDTGTLTITEIVEEGE